MIYFIRNNCTGNIKIGRGEPEKRRSALQTGNEALLEIIAVMPGDGREERQIHTRFGDDRIRGEWFRPSEPLMEVIRSLSNQDKHYGCLYLFDAPHSPDARQGPFFIPTMMVAGYTVEELVDDLISELRESYTWSGPGSTVIIAWRTKVQAIIEGEEEPWPVECARFTLPHDASRDQALSFVRNVWKKMCW